MALEDLSTNIRTARKARGLSQEAVARRADISLNLMGRIELGTVRNPHYRTLHGIAHALGMTVDELVEGTPGKASAPPDTGPAESAEGPPSAAREAAEAATNAVFEAAGEAQPEDLEALGGILGDWAWALYEEAAGGDRRLTSEARQEEFARRLSEGLLARVREERGGAQELEKHVTEIVIRAHFLVDEAEAALDEAQDHTDRFGPELPERYQAYINNVRAATQEFEKDLGPLLLRMHADALSEARDRLRDR
jgi:transcriptional regulator with XRE-family HTH domain